MTTNTSRAAGAIRNALQWTDGWMTLPELEGRCELPTELLRQGIDSLPREGKIETSNRGGSLHVVAGRPSEYYLG